MRESSFDIIRAMKQLREGTLLLAAFVGVALTLCGCATSSHQLMAWDGDTISRRELTEVLRENPLAPRQNIRVTLVRQTERASVHVVQVRTAEIPHIHQTHDLVVFVVRGYGRMVMGSDTKTVRAGDV